ncbi:MAG: hypothetical protein IT384_19775 [Deltaproteobacteria bacterium]|nr:hypothetical protein [Deltaproteobacteria bacterium]
MRVSRLVVRGLAVAWALLAAGAADPEVRDGLELYRRLEYDRAVVVLGQALRRTDVTAEDRRAGLEALAFAYTAIGAEREAEETFHQLLDRVPSYALGADQSPRFRDAFRRAQSTWEEGRRVGITLNPDPDRCAVELSGDPDRVGEVVTVAERQDLARLTCDAARCSGERPEVPFWIEVRDHRGTVLGRFGPWPAKPSARPSASEAFLPWWAWVAVGAAAAGLGATVLVLSSPVEPPPGSLGTLRLP